VPGVPAPRPSDALPAVTVTTLGDVGEEGLLARIVPRLAPAPAALLGPGDDTAVVAAPDGRVVATTDTLVEGRDFRRDWSSAADVGWKAAAQNLADVAAMGAVPTALLVALVAPPDLPVAWAEGLADGLSAGCLGTGAGVVGGDLSSGDAVVVSITALGDLQGRPAVLRSGARPGDVVAVAGVLGRSAGGLALLVAGRPELDPGLVEAHRRPRPPYAAGPDAARAGATAMLDVSDGLLRDLARVARASGVAVDLDGAELAAHLEPLRAAADRVGADPWQWLLGGGEDHALAATFPASVALPAGFTRVGAVVAADGPVVGSVLLDGVAPGHYRGWDHFGGA
jgi:thiamine-monophosphate kinase